MINAICFYLNAVFNNYDNAAKKYYCYFIFINDKDFYKNRYFLV